MKIWLDIVGTVYHLVIYMQSNKIHNVVLMSKFYSALFVSSTCFGPHQSITRRVFYKLYSQTSVRGNTRTARHVQPLQSCRKNWLRSRCASCWTAYMYIYIYIRKYDFCAFHAGYLRLQTLTQNMQYVLLFKCNNGCAKTQNCYVLRTALVSSFKKKKNMKWSADCL